MLLVRLSYFKQNNFFEFEVGEMCYFIAYS